MRLRSFHTKGLIEVGCDEAGRGCLAGPVVAAAVILPKNFRHSDLNDSKQITEKKRNELRILIEKKAIDWAVGIVCNKEIDEINILNASFLAMHRAIDKLYAKYDCLLIDGNRFNKYKEIKHHCIIKGDGKYKSIAAASILAKTHRDELMQNFSNEFPQYEWHVNKGYPTKKHRTAIMNHGSSVYHRMSFKLLAEEMDNEITIAI